MVTGRGLIENGWPEGPTIGLALAAARKLRAAGIIHPGAWKGYSPKLDFCFTEFSEVQLTRDACSPEAEKNVR